MLSFIYRANFDDKALFNFALVYVLLYTLERIHIISRGFWNDVIVHAMNHLLESQIMYVESSDIVRPVGSEASSPNAKVAHILLSIKSVCSIRPYL